ncbi:MAG: FHA domain-containing protein [Anaerolineales bacterium]|nr:FHA domain-containing protein [Anaerolineales bacterium]
MSPATSRLIVRTGPNPGMVFDLTKEITTMGRDVANDIVLGDPEVSRQHARLTRTPGGYVLEDLGSTNGTFVNNERLAAPRVLRGGDVVGLSEKVTLDFEFITSETAETVVSPSAEPAVPTPTVREAPPIQAEPPPPQMPSAEPPPPVMQQAPPPDDRTYPQEEPKGRSPWLAAGCGCLVVIAVLIVVLWYMDANHPDILYAPLRILGFY